MRQIRKRCLEADAEKIGENGYFGIAYYVFMTDSPVQSEFEMK